MNSELIVFVHIALYVIAGWLARGGWLPDDMQSQFVDPATVEAIAGILAAGGTVAWYWVSRARQALKVAVEKSK